MKQFWKKYAAVILLVIMLLTYLFSDIIFSVEIGKIVLSMVLGVSCLLYIPLKFPIWFGTKYLREGIFAVVGVGNILMSILMSILMLTN